MLLAGFKIRWRRHAQGLRASALSLPQWLFLQFRVAMAAVAVSMSCAAVAAIVAKGVPLGGLQLLGVKQQQQHGATQSSRCFLSRVQTVGVPKMVALAVASVSSKCFVSIQDTALWSCHRGRHRRFQPPASRLNFQHNAELRTRERRTLPQRDVVTASSSHQNASKTNLSEERYGDNAAAEDLSPNFELLLMEKADELRDDLQGTCIFLIGLMDSGKTAIGKTLAKELGYYFFDSNDLVQQAAGGTDLSEDEEGYREAETEVLKQLSAMGRLVVSTGAGTVAKSENWGNLRHGIVVWVDMPVETVANCARTRQLLVPNCADGDEALVKLSKLYEERKETYKNADATVSIPALSARLGIEDPATISPSMTALEVLNVIGALIKEKQAKKLRL